MKEENENTITRKTFLKYAASLTAVAGASAILPSYALAGFKGRDVVKPKGPENILDLTIARTPIMIDGKEDTAVSINGTVPGPLIHLKEGEDVLIRVKNELDEKTSIHWHGVLVPFVMDGVPGVNFDGIEPGETFEYRYNVHQYGTYWYHSHSGLQEQLGTYGPIFIESAGEEPIEYDRQYPVVLGDWTFEDPNEVLENLKKSDGYYNYQKRTLFDFFDDVAEEGLGDALNDYLMWGKMRMSRTDLLDVTGATYTYLMNGRGPESNWTALFNPGERVRLRFINASAATIHDVRIPGLDMTVVQADGQWVEPVTIHEFRIGNAETYDVIVEPKEKKAYTIFSESLDRSGYARGTLAPREGMEAPVPDLRPRPLRTMKGMGMNMAAMDMGGMNMDGMDMDDMKKKNGGKKGMEHGKGHEGMKMDMGGMDMEEMNMQNMEGPIHRHAPGGHGGIGTASVAEYQYYRLDEPGLGLGNDGWDVLVYEDLRALQPYQTDNREPAREVEIHLTGNMERYMWSFDGKEFHEVDAPIPFKLNERLKLTMVNDTMMEHPIHLHGMWMELQNNNGIYSPRKHTILVKPASRVSLLISPREKGRWAFHCHILYHMMMGMFRVVEVTDEDGDID